MEDLDNLQRRVWIAGGGISGSFAALRFLRLGYSVTIWQGRIVPYRAVESIPKQVQFLLEEMDAADCIAKSDGQVFGDFCSVERASFAESLLDKACQAGGELRDIQEMPLPWEGCCDALIDASGRRAAWSGKVRRFGREVADLYDVRLRDSDSGREIVSGEDFWAYYLRARSLATVAVVTRHHGNVKKATEDAFHQLQINASTARFTGRRFCSPQWAEEPILANRISVGDAAFAYYPLAGAGIRFALTSATAAVAALHTQWSRPAAKTLAIDYYFELCEAARVSHLSNLTLVPVISRVSNTDQLIFKAREIEGGVQEGDFVVPRKTYLLANGSRLRWLGSMDLAELRQFAQFSISRRSLLEKLGHILPPGTDVERLINWCIQHEILGETDKVNLPTTQQDRLPSRSSGGV